MKDLEKSVDLQEMNLQEMERLNGGNIVGALGYLMLMDILLNPGEACGAFMRGWRSL